MHEPSFILRPLILVFLSGWVGIAAQPAVAQQTVALSGRVTDSTGNAVSGVRVDLSRLPAGPGSTDRTRTATAPITSRFRQGPTSFR